VRVPGGGIRPRPALNKTPPERSPCQKDEVDMSDKIEDATDTAQSACNGLLCCPDCKSPAEESCVIHTSKRREPHEKNHAFVECKKCGYSIGLSTGGSVILIRKLWNTRLT